MIGITLIRTLKAIIAILLMDLNRVANTKPRIGTTRKKWKNLPSNSVVENHNSTSTTKDQQPAKLDVKLQHEEPNTLGGDYQGPETNLAFKDLVG